MSSFMDEIMGKPVLDLNQERLALPKPAPKKRGKGKKTATTDFERCHKTHPPVHLSAGTFTGGSCSDPVEGADIYVNLDRNVPFRARKFPWTPGVEFDYPIMDMGVPANPANFKIMIEWLAQRLAEGKHVHVGCIGGHGRTGMVLAVLVKTINGTEDAITWVRKHYCKKAVENSAQVKFLHDTFGIAVVKGAKTYPAAGTTTTTLSGGSWNGVHDTGPYEAGSKLYYAMNSSSKNVWRLPKFGNTE